MSDSAAAAALEARIATGDSLDVRHFEVEEGLSTLFEVHLEIVSDNPDIDFSEVVGKPARFSLQQGHTGGVARTWLGVCSHIELVTVEDTGLSTYALSIVPALWLLSHRRNHRMFQQKSEPQIALQLLAEWEIEVEARLEVASYPTREYRLQYGESDYAFLCRMLEDAGITFFFETVDDRPLMVLSDEPTSRDPRAPLPYVSDHDHPVDSEYATDLRIVRQVRPGRYTQRDVDHRRPPSFPVVASAAGGLDAEARLERFQYNPGALLFEQSAAGDTPVADDRGVYRADLDRGSEQARRRLDAKQGSGRIVLFRAQATALRPGEVLTIVGHPRSDLGAAHPLLVIAASHQGHANGRYIHRFEARFADVAYRPPLVTPKPRVTGVESATVVGPVGEEIHVDELGRVRLHFHWDRESEMNEQSSCWVPVSHPWAGTGYGAVNLPRIGQEVIVSFLGADPDRPVIVGRVYTALQQVPYALPGNKTQSGWRSHSSPSTGGYNELMFEDAAGRELVRFQAEKNFAGLVKNDSSLTVGHDQSRMVGNDDSHVVGANQANTIGQNRLVQVGANHRRLVGANLSQGVVGSATHLTKDDEIHVSEKRLILKVGSSMIVLLPDKIIIEAPDVFINPRDAESPPPPPSFLERAASAIDRMGDAVAANPALLLSPGLLGASVFFGSP